MLNPTPRDQMLDDQGRPYFLWDCDLDLATFQERLQDPDPEIRAYFLGKLMRQAKPDDVFEFVDVQTIREQWSRAERYLGEKREFWSWLLNAWADKKSA